VTLSDSGGTANEGVDTSAPQTFGITVNPVNDQPTATGQSQNLIGVTFIDITLAASDVETAPDQLVYNIVTPPSHGDLTPLGGAAYRYTLKNASYVGDDSFAFTVTDDGDPAGSHSNTGDLTSDPATVNLQVGQKRVFAAGKPAKFTDSNGNLVTVALTGPGSMDFWFAGPGNYDLGLLNLYNTTDKSSLSVTVTPKPKATIKTTTIGIINVQQGSLGSLTAAAASLTGDLTVSGTLGKAAFYDLTGGGTIQIGGTANAKIGASLTFNQVKDTNLSSAMPIASLTAKAWLETDGTPETITAPSLGTLTIAGGLGANLTLLGTGLLPKGITLTTATVSGAVASSTWDVTGLVGKVTLAGAVGAAGHPWELKDATGLTSLTAGDVVDAALTVAGDIGAVKAIRWQAGSIQAKSVGSVATTGAKAAGISGDFGAALTLTGTTSTKVGATTLGTAAIVGALAPSTWDVTGLVGKVTISGVVGAASQPWELKNATGLASLTAGDVVDAALTVAGDIGAVKAIRWQAGSIQANSAVSVATTGAKAAGISGDFGAALTLTGTTSTKAGATTLGSAAIAGNVTRGTWDVTGLVGKVTLAGAVGASQPWELKNATGLASLTAGDVVDAALTVAGDIGAVKAIRWQAGSIQAKSAGSVATTGAKTAGIPGDFGAALTLTGTTSTKAGATTLGSAAIAGDVTPGVWDVKGLVGKLTLAGAVGASQPWELKSATGLASLTAGDVVDAALTVAGNIGPITAKRWQAGSIQAPAITSITTTGVADTNTTVGYTGDFIADLILTDAARTTLGKMTIAGWLVTNLTSAGSLGTLTVGGLRDATITVGNAGTPSGIAGLTVKGGVKNQTDALINSNVMAWGDVTAVAVTKVQTSNVDHGHAALGIKARTIKSYMRDKVKYVAPPGSKIVDHDADYTAELI
jgi:hypothetical protein